MKDLQKNLENFHKNLEKERNIFLYISANVFKYVCLWKSPRLFWETFHQIMLDIGLYQVRFMA